MITLSAWGQDFKAPGVDLLIHPCMGDPHSQDPVSYLTWARGKGGGGGVCQAGLLKSRVTMPVLASDHLRAVFCFTPQGYLCPELGANTGSSFLSTVLFCRRWKPCFTTLRCTAGMPCCQLLLGHQMPSSVTQVAGKMHKFILSEHVELVFTVFLLEISLGHLKSTQVLP